MSSVFLLIPLALASLAVAVWAFVWAVRNGQFEDLDSPAARILFDDEMSHHPRSASGSTPGPPVDSQASGPARHGGDAQASAATTGVRRGARGAR